MNSIADQKRFVLVSAGCHINDVMNYFKGDIAQIAVSAGCHINDVMNTCET